MDAVERIERSTAHAAKAVSGVKADQLSAPTPCSDFDVKALLNHLFMGMHMLTTAAKSGKAEVLEGDIVGPDPAKQYDEARAKLLEAIREPGVFDKNWEMPFAALPGQVMAGIAFWEHLAHGWDIAKATGQDATIPDDLAQEALDSVTPMDAMIRMPGVCGPKVDVPSDASITDRLVGFLGRQP
jgi:uncharacterized protein (TIGR03086 family)